jgi:WD40 repeat protein
MTQVRSWNVADGQTGHVIEGGGAWVVAFRPDGERYARAGREAVTLHHSTSGKELISLDPFGDWDRSFPFRPAIVSLAFSPDGRRLVTGGSVAKTGGPHGLPGGSVIVWDAESGEPLHRTETLSTSVAAVAFSNDGRRIAVATNGAGGELPEPGEVFILEAGTGKVVRRFEIAENVRQGEWASVSDIAFRPDGALIAAASGAGRRGRPAGLITGDAPAVIRLWDIESGREVGTIGNRDARVQRLAYSPDGTQLATAGGDGHVCIWNASTGKRVQTLPFEAKLIGSVAFSADGRFLAVGGGNNDRYHLARIRSGRAGNDVAPGTIRVWRLGQK